MILTSPYIAATLPAIFALLYDIQVFYLRSSRQLRLLDLEHKSPSRAFQHYAHMAF